jgi:magnesium transporter
MFSQFIHYQIIDDRGGKGRVTDLAVDLAAGDYPMITRLIYRGPDRVPRTLAWPADAVDWRRRQIHVANLSVGDPGPPEALANQVLLGRDVLDALILDLQQRRATRANDLELQESDGKLWLCAADTSAWGVLRRLSGGRLRHQAPGALYDWKYVEFLRGEPQAALHGRDYHRRIARLPPGEIARLADALPYLHAAELITLLPDPVAADTLEAFLPDRQVQVFEELDGQQARRLLLLMRPDIVADLLGRLDPDDARRWLESMATAQRERVLKLLRYPDDTAGGIMTNDLIALPADLTVEESLPALRERLSQPDFINFIYDLYIVDAEDTQRLLGALPLRDLIAADPGRTLAEIMNPYQMVLYPLEPALDAARNVIDSELRALPVVARDGELLGAVTIDAALALAAPESWRSQAPRLFS